MSTSTHTSLDIDVPGLDQLFIGGQWVDPASDRRVDVVMPSTEETLASVADPATADADRAAQAARKAFEEGPWPTMSAAERVAGCRRLADAMSARMTDLNKAWIYEAGVTVAHAEMLNGAASPMIWDYALEVAEKIGWEEPRATPTGDILLRREPVGPVLSIMTYNGPVPLMGMKVIPALLAGCPVVIKYAPESQLTSRIISDCVAEADLPEGVISALAAGTEVTRHLVGHQDIDMITLTGGPAIAVDVIKRSADRLARTLMELGGKAPAIIGEDADMDAVIASGLVDGCTGYQGQVCVTISRILAPRGRYDEIVDVLAERYAALKVGDPFDPTSDRGPLAVERARERTEHYVAIAQEQGAKVATGGRRPPELERGWYYEPTLLRDVTNDMTVAQEEVFGPVTCVIPYDGLDDAIRIANATRFGLNAAVYMADKDKAADVARRIRAGAVSLNTVGVCLSEPFGGLKQSGWGRECGPEGILEFTDIKQILLGGSYLDA
ncbi:MAG TPA: aldehyde dehydrogenase family protein [Solirubrobacteraceae bacterium]|jgi:acyl-CoA reductase-like NAD-dependent aldehyde dehydrogenase|nr:aldehyde dehydrogenase family protein [Solirubrobacteraceae bacterium]